jgi:hypothetical protein
LAGTAKPARSSTGDAAAVFEKRSPYVRALRFTLPLPPSGSPGILRELAERKVAPREANVAHDNSLAKDIGSFMSTRSVNGHELFPDLRLMISRMGVWELPARPVLERRCSGRE